MLSDTLFRIPRAEGLHLLQGRQGPRAARALTSWRLRLAPGGSATYRSRDEESVLVLQEGRGHFATPEAGWDVSRQSVFQERATALLLPPDVPVTVTAATTIEAIVVSATATAGGRVALIGPGQVTVGRRGKGAYAREVHDLFVSDAFATRLMVGETFNPAGHWSSYPPHKHDGKNGEPVLEEVYHYRCDPPHGFGHQMLYSNGESVTHQVRDGDAVLLPYGYHPVSAPPGYRLYYLWALAGDERKLAVYEDPVHRWIHELG